MASSDSDDDYSEEEEEEEDSEYSDFDEEEEEDGLSGASDEDDEDGSDSEYYLDGEDDDEEEEEEEEEEEDEDEEDEGQGEEEEDGGEVIEDDLGEGDDGDEMPALEHAQMEPDEISQSTDGPFSGQSTPDVPTNGLAVGSDPSLTNSAKNPKIESCRTGSPTVISDAETTPSAVAGTDLGAKDDDSPSPLTGDLNNMKIYDPSELPANAATDNRSAVQGKGQ